MGVVLLFMGNNVVSADKNNFPRLHGIDLEQRRNKHEILFLYLARLLDHNEALIYL